MTALGSNAHIFAQPHRRQDLRWCFETALGCGPWPPWSTQAAERACIELAAAGQPVTFTTVAARSRVPRGTLYRNPALWAVVEEHRSRARQAATLPDITAELASQRLALEALAERVRRHEELLRKLTGKNWHRAPATRSGR